MKNFRLMAAIVLIFAGLTMMALRAVNSDAWAVGQFGSAVGEAFVPFGLLALVGVLVWPRKPRLSKQ
jgi:hypothetical protein